VVRARMAAAAGERARVGSVGERWAFIGPAECKFVGQVADRRM
jgi:hypothetical protein